MTHTLLRKIVSEFVGTGFLVAAVVGSGIMGERLGRWERCDSASGQHHRNRRGAVRFNSHLRADLRWTFQSRRYVCGRDGARCVVDGGRVLHPGAVCGSDLRRNRGALDVRLAGNFDVQSCAKRFSASIQRIRRDVRSNLRDLGMRASTLGHGSVRGGGVRHRCILVYFVNIVRKSSRHNRSVTLRHILRNSTRGRAHVCRGAIRRSNCSDISIPLARSRIEC
jgi:hypothetical protein